MILLFANTLIIFEIHETNVIIIASSKMLMKVFVLEYKYLII